MCGQYRQLRRRFPARFPASHVDSSCTLRTFRILSEPLGSASPSWIDPRNCMKRLVWLLFGALVCTSSGCALFSHFTNGTNDKSDKPPTPMVGAPTKHVTRVAQFWFFCDVE